jgi:hypothetical protein
MDSMNKNRFVIAACLLACSSLPAQQTTYNNITNVTGQLVLTRTVNPSLLGAARTLSVRTSRAANKTAGDIESTLEGGIFDEVPRILQRLAPPIGMPATSESLKSALASARFAIGLQTVTGLPVNLNSGAFGFNGLTHLDQVSSNSGNQYNTEPPNPSIAVANGYVLLGVNNAIQVYSLLGAPLLPRVLSSNELYGVSPAIIRSTGVNGVYPTDMRVFHDQGINRWFVLQRAQDYNVFGDEINSSHLYMAVSQTPDPTGAYNIYVMNTTDSGNILCPCLADYPSIGADQYGFYISSNEYNINSHTFVNAQIHAISKQALLSGVAGPTTFRIQLPFTTGYEFAIHPATTPPGASYFAASNGVQYFVSTIGNSTSGSKLAVYALSGTASLLTPNPGMTMVQVTVSSLNYIAPNVVSQKPGALPYGSTLGYFTPIVIDGGDTRIQAVTYAGGRIYTTMATALNDETGHEVVGGGFVILSPTFRNGVLSAPPIRQGYFAVRGNHLLRSAIAVNAQGRGGIAATLVGPDHFPSSVFLPIETFSGPTSVQVAAAGSAPQDGFTGYQDGVARWGDYSTPFVTSDGSLWMAVEYIPSLPRSQFANWGIFISKY